MIEQVVNYIGEKNEWLKSKGLCILKEQRDGLFLPVKKTKTNYELIHNFDKLAKFSYFRVVGQVDVERVISTTNNNKLYQLTYPCRLIYCDKSLNDANALNLIGSLSIKNIDRTNLDVYNLTVNIVSYNTVQETVISDEFGNLKLNGEFNFILFNVNIVITIDANCLELC